VKHISSMTRPGNQPQKLAALKQAWQEWNNSPDVLIRLARRLATTLSLEDQLGVLAEEMADIVPFEAMMYRHTIARQEFVFRTGMGGPHRAEYRLSLEGELYGYLELHRRTRFSEEELEAIEVFIGAAICPIRNACRFIALEQMALTDTLTGVPNRRALDEDLGRICHLANRHNENHSLILVDLDHFKAVNDTHGHLIGDQVLRMSAAGLTRTLRNSDRVYRFGGEEFAVALPGRGARDAAAVAERMRAAVAQLRGAWVAAPDMSLTASFGVGATTGGSSLDGLISIADAAMYVAKRAGGDRVSVMPEDAALSGA